jgi:paraquat-inducible protein A
MRDTAFSREKHFVRDWWRAILLVAAPAFLALGVSLPLMRFESFYFLKRDASLFDIVVALWMGGDSLLAVVVGLVSVLLPIAKLLLVTAENLSPKVDFTAGGIGRVLPHLSRWSMMDVLLVAIVIFATKTSGFAEAFIQPGLWFYAGSSLAVAVLHARPRGDRHNV